MHREAVARELQRRLKHVGERPGAEIPQRGHQRVERGGNAGRQQPGAGNQLEAERAKVGNRRPRGRHHIAVDRHDAAGRCGINQHRRLAADCVHVRVDDALDECSSDGSVDSISATSEDSRTGGSGKVVLGRDHRATAHNQRVNRRHRGSFFLRSPFITRLFGNANFRGLCSGRSPEYHAANLAKRCLYSGIAPPCNGYLENQPQRRIDRPKKENRGFVRFSTALDNETEMFLRRLNIRREDC